MKILFVFRIHDNEIRNPIVYNQSESLIKSGIEVGFFPIRNGGLHYFKYFFKLRKYLKKDKYDLVHAHYGYTAILVGLSNPGKTITSLMGSDIYRQHGITRFIIKHFSDHIWDKTIVKSVRMNEIINNSIIIANGVNLDLFKQENKEESRLKVGFNKQYNIIFISVRPEEKVKNLKLAKQAIQLIDNENIHFHVISNIENKRLSCYYSAADMVLLTSVTEGSPNVIKEAMACNCPIVSTDVGDVRDVIGNTKGCYISSFAPIDIAEKIKKALEYSSTKGRTNGRQRIMELGLDSESIANRIVEVYKKVLNS
jgi:teichuronic acid biosynthesis glycosyltransferase TuaC